MKILEVTPFFSPVHGGSAEVPFQLCRELAKRGHQVTVYTSDFRLTREYIDAIPEVAVLPFKTRLNFASFTFTPGIVKSVKESLTLFDIVHLHTFRTYQNVVVHGYANRSGVPYVLQAHGSAGTFFQKGMLKKKFDSLWGRAILKDASRLIAVTGVEADQYLSLGASREQISVIPHGIDLAEFDRLPERGAFRKRHGLSAGERVVLFLGRIDRIKGLDLLITAFAGLKGNDAKLVIAGPDFGFLKQARQLAKKLGIGDRVLFPGPLYGQSKLEAYVDADVFVLPSNYEIFGITILEACACGTPVVTTDRCGLADTIANRAGLSVPYDAGALREALGRILTDRGLQLQFAEAGKRLVRDNFSWAQIAGRVERLYQEVIGQSKK